MFREFKLALAVLLLVAIPTAILSLLAARAFRDWDAIMEQQLQAVSEQTLAAVATEFGVNICRLQAQAARLADEVRRDPAQPALVERVRTLRAEFPLLRQFYVGRLTGPWLYPREMERFASAPAAIDRATGQLLGQARDLQFRRNDFSAAATLYAGLLDRPETPTAARCEAWLLFAQCQRRLNQPARAIESLAAMVAAGDQIGNAADSEGYLYRLTALRALTELRLEIGEPAALLEVGIALIDAVAGWYGAMAPFQRQSLEAFFEQRLLPAMRHAATASGARAAGARLAPALQRLAEARNDNRFLARHVPGLRALAAGTLVSGPPPPVWRMSESEGGIHLFQVTADDGGGIIVGIQLDQAVLLKRILARPIRSIQAPIQLLAHYGGKPLTTATAFTPGAGWQRMAQVELLAGYPVLTVSAWHTDMAALRAGARVRAQLYRWGVVLLALTILGGIAAAVHFGLREVRRARARSNFMAGVSHDIRTPLASMRMLAESLHQDSVTDEGTRRNFLGAIVRESARLGQMTERALYLVRFGHDALYFNLVDHDLGELVRETVSAFGARFQAGEIELNVTMAPDLPPVSVDGAAMSQVLLNLLENAVKYSPDRKAIEVTAMPGLKGRTVEVAVRDHGIGIAARDRRRIFRNFSRGRDPRVAGIAGVGLGLALCRFIVRAHGGTIGVESPEGGGSLFRVTLPAASA